MSGNYYLRYYLIEAANSVRVREPEYAAFYRKLVRMVFTLLSEGQIYRHRRLG
ncbi:hypothetical protein MGLY_01360 [Neomoorella glycerini]|uniref:Uncharacterized protein n=1 Tax=Neomoorella glycerini TaxID=55779 RepID=A0A6I5ZMI8_9FIRM|nr:hypothetical protein MGLY_01360 [Moorella glycerini]